MKSVPPRTRSVLGILFFAAVILPLQAKHDLQAENASSHQANTFQADGKSTADIKSELTGKTKAEVKAYFGRPPDQATGESMWRYKGQFIDTDAEKTFPMAVVTFGQDDKVMLVMFVGGR